MVYTWTHGPGNSVKMAPDMRLSQFDLIGFPAGNETVFNAGGTIITFITPIFML